MFIYVKDDENRNEKIDIFLNKYFKNIDNWCVTAGFEEDINYPYESVSDVNKELLRDGVYNNELFFNMEENNFNIPKYEYGSDCKILKLYLWFKKVKEYDNESKQEIN